MLDMAGVRDELTTEEEPKSLGQKSILDMKVKVAQLCLTVCNPMDGSLPGCSAHGILQARILEWETVPLSKGSSQPRNQTQVLHIADRFFTI